MTQCPPALGKQDRLAPAARLRDYCGTNAMGPAAIVALSNESYQQARLFETRAVADRPLKIFRDLQAARDWLDSEPVEALSPPSWRNGQARPCCPTFKMAQARLLDTCRSPSSISIAHGP